MAEFLTYYLIAVNFIAFAAFGLDKSFAENGSWRISEATLFLLAFFGGLPGALAGRSAFRHKTRKRGFLTSLLIAGLTPLVVLIGIKFATIFGSGSPLTLFESAEDRAAREAVEESVWYAGCDQVRAEGKAPLYRGQPGYGEHMDGDGDGVACELHY